MEAITAKIFKQLRFPYPSGSEVGKLAHDGNTKAVTFPRPMISSKKYDFSFSRLKTAVLPNPKKRTPRKKTAGDPRT